MATLRRTCETVPQPSELRFGVVREVGRGIAVLHGGPRRARGRVRFKGFCSPFSQWEMPLDPRLWNVSDSYAETWQHFRSANVSWKSRFVVRWCIRFQQPGRGLWEISKNVTIVRPHSATCSGVYFWNYTSSCSYNNTGQQWTQHDVIYPKPVNFPR